MSYGITLASGHSCRLCIPGPFLERACTPEAEALQTPPFALQQGPAIPCLRSHQCIESFQRFSMHQCGTAYDTSMKMPPRSHDWMCVRPVLLQVQSSAFQEDLGAPGLPLGLRDGFIGLLQRKLLPCVSSTAEILWHTVTGITHQRRCWATAQHWTEDNSNSSSSTILCSLFMQIGAEKMWYICMPCACLGTHSISV